MLLLQSLVASATIVAVMTVMVAVVAVMAVVMVAIVAVVMAVMASVVTTSVSTAVSVSAFKRGLLFGLCQKQKRDEVSLL